MCYTVNVKKRGNITGFYNAVALCAVGAEKVVSNEIKKLELSIVDSGFGKIRFQADTSGLYRALIGLRAADRILLEMGFFNAVDFDVLLGLILTSFRISSRFSFACRIFWFSRLLCSFVALCCGFCKS